MTLFYLLRTDDGKFFLKINASNALHGEIEFMRNYSLLLSGVTMGVHWGPRGAHAPQPRSVPPPPAEVCVPPPQPRSVPPGAPYSEL